jgi:hypothetical protein
VAVALTVDANHQLHNPLSLDTFSVRLGTHAPIIPRIAKVR